MQIRAVVNLVQLSVYYLLFQVINKLIPIRMIEHEELLGADFFEHDIRHQGVGVSRAISVLKNFHDDIDSAIAPTTVNRGNTLRNYKYPKYYTYNNSHFSRRYRQYNVYILSLSGHDLFLEKYYSKEDPCHNSIQKFENDANEMHDNVELNGKDIELGKKIPPTA